MTYVVEKGPGGKSVYGNNLEFFRYQGPEAILHGPAETGKTFALCYKVHLCALKYPNANIAVVRKTQTSTYSTVVRTFTERVLGGREDWPCIPYGGDKRPERFIYWNGSTIWIGGMDRASRVLSSDFDIIAVVQAEELTVEDWETLTTRTTGRAGHLPYAQTIGDANPAWPTHWMYHREGLRLFYSKHEDNPVLYDPITGELTEQGRQTLAVLDRLTGVRKQRLRYGVPAQAEGAVYTEYSEAQHRVYRDAVPALFPRYVAGVDWGYRNPGVLAVFGVTGDGAMYLVAQWYRTGRTDDWWLKRAKAARREFGIEAFVCDPSQPAYIDKFRGAGLNAVKGFNAVLPGISAVKRRLAQGQLFFVRDSLREPDPRLVQEQKPHQVEDEFPGYVWADTGAKEQPVKEDDHGMDALRYAVGYVDKLGEDDTGRAAWVPGQVAADPF